MFLLEKSRPDTDRWEPLERGTARIQAPSASPLVLVVRDALGRIYAEVAVAPGADETTFVVRGALGWHTAELHAPGEAAPRSVRRFRVTAATALAGDHPPLGQLFDDLTRVLRDGGRPRAVIEIDGRRHAAEVDWSRDHAFTLKSTRYFRTDVTSGTELWLTTQRADGSFWDCFHQNPSGAPNWFCEALGEGWFAYYNHGRLMARRIPIEADVEYCIAEAVLHGWQATGDDAWARRWLPALEAALAYTTSDRWRWSARHQLVKRSFCMDSWDFAHPAYCAGDHRCLHEGDPAFLFHGDNSGLYQHHLQLAALHDAVGDPARAAALRAAAAALRERANRALFAGSHYGHMIPEELPEAEVCARVGDERARLSLSTGYTINRGLPTHEMAVAILDEYQRRRAAKASESWAEWWTMDPPYTHAQWPANGPAPGDYMNGGICLIAAGELARAACVHGREAYAADILERVAALGARDGGRFQEVYRRLPADAAPPPATWTPLDLSAVANRGLRHGAHPGVPAWTDEGDNDFRGLPVGDHTFAGAAFHILDPVNHAGRAVLHLDRNDAPVRIPVPADAVYARSLAFLHATARSQPAGIPVAIYRLHYADGTSHPAFIRAGHEIGHWWGATADMISRPERYDAPTLTALGWQGPNGTWKTTGVFVHSLANPFPQKELTAVELDPSPLRAQPRGTLLVCAVSACDQPAGLGLRTRSGGLPLVWALSSVFHGLMNGLVGIEDRATAFREVAIAPRLAATPARHVRACLHYPASDGYCLYDYTWDPAAARIILDLTGNFDRASVHLLLPPGHTVRAVTLAGAAVPFALTRIEFSTYVDFEVGALPPGPIQIELTAS